MPPNPAPPHAGAARPQRGRGGGEGEGEGEAAIDPFLGPCCWSLLGVVCDVIKHQPLIQHKNEHLQKYSLHIVIEKLKNTK